MKESQSGFRRKTSLSSKKIPVRGDRGVDSGMPSHFSNTKLNNTVSGVGLVHQRPNTASYGSLGLGNRGTGSGVVPAHHSMEQFFGSGAKGLYPSYPPKRGASAVLISDERSDTKYDWKWVKQRKEQADMNRSRKEQ